MISLRTVDAEYTGVCGAWTDVAKALCDAGYLSASAQLRIKSLEQFGSLINKTDMHLGSLSLSIDGDRFSLLPAYDMCSMGFSLKGAEVADLQLDALERTLKSKTFEPNVKEAAIEFWNRVASDERSPSELKNFISTVQPAKLIGVSR